MPTLNPLLRDTCSPPIPGARRWIESYDGRYGEVLNLSQAAPGTPPPASLLSALAIAAGDPRFTGYGPIRGEPELIAAYAAHISDQYRTVISPDEVAITAGCNEAFFITALAVAKSGDAVLLPTPWYFNHAMTLSMLGIEAVPLPTRPEDGFLPRLDIARDVVAHRRLAGLPVPKAIVLVTPNNPTGAIYGGALLSDFAVLADEIDGWLIIDETYRDFLAGSEEAPPHTLFSGPCRARLIQLYSFSKAYCIPGHRLGAMVVPPDAMGDIDKVLDSLQICPGRIGQVAVAPAIAGLSDWRRSTAVSVTQRASRFADFVKTVPGWRVDAIGAYFAYVAHPFAGIADTVVAEALARERGILVLPGSFFGSDTETHLRFAFANVDDARIAELPARFADFHPMHLAKNS